MWGQTKRSSIKSTMMTLSASLASGKITICQRGLQTKLPDNVEWVDDGSILFYDGGKFTKVKKTLEDANLEHEIEEKIKKKLRDNAIADLKASGDIPEDFDDSRLIKIKKEK
jgi:hypothetical protein